MALATNSIGGLLAGLSLGDPFSSITILGLQSLDKGSGINTHEEHQPRPGGVRSNTLTFSLVISTLGGDYLTPP